MVTGHSREPAVIIASKRIFWAMPFLLRVEIWNLKSELLNLGNSKSPSLTTVEQTED